MTAPKLAHDTDNGRYYTHPANASEVPSITNVKDMKNVEALKYWAAGECANYAADNIDALRNLDRDDIYQLVRKAPFSRKSKKVTAAIIGDIVHDWIDRVAKGEAVADIDVKTYIDKAGNEQQVPVQAKWTWYQFAGKGDSFLNIMKPDWQLTEFTVWSDRYGYAGTMDWAAKIGGKKWLTLGDNKTGKSVYPDMALQLAAGQFADYILLPDANTESGYRQVEIPQFERYAILHLRPRGWSLVPLYKIPEAFEAFLGLRQVFEWKVQCQDTTVGNAPKYEVRVGNQ